MIKGFDCSHHNTINWKTLSPELKFVYIKASQGETYHDPMFQDHWHNSRDKGLLHGAYHFWTAQGDVNKQVDNFMSRGIDWSLHGVLPPVLDFEDQVGKDDAETKQLNQWMLNNRQKCIDSILEWLVIIEHKTGRLPVVYSYKGFFDEYLHNPVEFNEYKLWIASYQNKEPGLPPMFDKYTFWQNSQFGKQDGSLIGGNLDMDLFNGSIEELAKL